MKMETVVKPIFQMRERLLNGKKNRFDCMWRVLACMQTDFQLPPAAMYTYRQRFWAFLETPHTLSLQQGREHSFTF